MTIQGIHEHLSDEIVMRKRSIFFCLELKKIKILNTTTIRKWIGSRARTDKPKPKEAYLEYTKNHDSKNKVSWQRQQNWKVGLTWSLEQFKRNYLEKNSYAGLPFQCSISLEICSRNAEVIMIPKPGKTSNDLTDIIFPYHILIIWDIAS